MYTSDGDLHTVMLDIKEPSRVKASFNWQDNCGNPIKSKYLPIRPGSKLTDETHNYEVIRIYTRRTFLLSDYLSAPIYKANILFYVYSDDDTDISIDIVTITSLIVTVNHEKESIADWKSYHKCIVHGRHHSCIFHESYDSHMHGKTKLTFQVKQSWNLIQISNILNINWYSFKLNRNVNIRHTTFIPWYTSLPTRCKVENEWLKKNYLFIKSVSIETNFTFGQEYGLGQIMTCLGIAFNQRKHKLFHFNMNFVDKYNLADIQLYGSNTEKLEFLLFLNNRMKSGQCIEYTCLHYHKVTNHIIPKEFMNSKKSLILYNKYTKNGPDKIIPLSTINEITKLSNGEEDYPICNSSFTPGSDKYLTFITIILHNKVYHKSSYLSIKKCLLDNFSILYKDIKFVTGRIGTNIAVIIPKPGNSLYAITSIPQSSCYERIQTTCYTKSYNFYHGGQETYNAYYLYNRITRKPWFYPVLVVSILLFMVLIFVIYKQWIKYKDRYQFNDEMIDYQSTYMNSEPNDENRVRISSGVLKTNFLDKKEGYNSYYDK